MIGENVKKPSIGMVSVRKWNSIMVIHYTSTAQESRIKRDYDL